MCIFNYKLSYCKKIPFLTNLTNFKEEIFTSLYLDKTKAFFPLYHFGNMAIVLFHLGATVLFQRKTIPVLFLSKEREFSIQNSKSLILKSGHSSTCYFARVWDCQLGKIESSHSKQHLQSLAARGHGPDVEKSVQLTGITHLRGQDCGFTWFLWCPEKLIRASHRISLFPFFEEIIFLYIRSQRCSSVGQLGNWKLNMVNMIPSLFLGAWLSPQHSQVCGIVGGQGCGNCAREVTGELVWCLGGPLVSTPSCVVCGASFAV